MDDPRAKWNDRYRARPSQSYPPPPSPWLAAHVEQLGHDFDPRFVLAPGELRRSFPGLEVVAERETLVERSGRQRAVASIVARRPMGSP
jgi:hypothetical protein